MVDIKVVYKNKLSPFFRHHLANMNIPFNRCMAGSHRVDPTVLKKWDSSSKHKRKCEKGTPELNLRVYIKIITTVKMKTTERNQALQSSWHIDRKGFWLQSNTKYKLGNTEECYYLVTITFQQPHQKNNYFKQEPFMILLKSNICKRFTNACKEKGTRKRNKNISSGDQN